MPVNVTAERRTSPSSLTYVAKGRGPLKTLSRWCSLMSTAVLTCRGTAGLPVAPGECCDRCLSRHEQEGRRRARRTAAAAWLGENEGTLERPMVAEVGREDLLVDLLLQEISGARRAADWAARTRRRGRTRAAGKQSGARRHASPIRGQFRGQTRRLQRRSRSRAIVGCEGSG